METYTTSSYEVNEGKERKQSVPFSMGKVLFWFAIGLLVTGVVSLTLPDILIATCGGSDNLNIILMNNVETGLIIGSSIVMIVCCVIIGLKRFTTKSVGMTIAYILYSICVGVLLSDIFMMVLAYEGGDAIKTIAAAFLISGGCFLIFGLIGTFMKKGVSILIPVASTLVIGALIISLMNWFMGSPMVYWISDFIIFAVILIYTVVDFNRIKKMADSTYFQNSYSMSVYCAFSLYCDFINIFIRILRYVLLFSSRRR